MKVIIQRSTIVRPATETPKHVIWCSNIDLVIPMIHTPTVYFYKEKIQGSNPNAFSLEHLKESLSKALVTFYPLAGRLLETPSCRYDIDCNAEGVLLVEAQADGCMSYYGEHFAPSTKMKELIPELDYSQPINSLPILILQVTFFRCGGVALGVGLQHVVADGMAALRFLNFWGDLARGVDIEIKPFFDRTIMQARVPPTPKFEHVEYQDPPQLESLQQNKQDVLKSTPQNNNIPNMNSQLNPNLNEHNEDNNCGRQHHVRVEVEELAKLSEDQRTSKIERYNRLSENDQNTSYIADLFLFTKDQVLALKNKATLSMVGSSNKELSHVFTSYEVLAAHIWRCVCQARGLDDTQLSKLYIAIDGRSRLHPHVPPDYFGNAIFTATPIKQSGDIVGAPLGEIAKFIRMSLHNMDDEYLRSALDYLQLQPNIPSLARGAHTFRSPNLGLTSWVRLPIYGLDLGWGEPLSMGPLEVPFEGLAYLLPGPPGDSNLRLSIALCPSHMLHFRKLIYDI